MFKLDDYLNYYKNITLDEVSLNDLDLALFAVLAYLPLKPFNKEKKLNTIIKESNEFNDLLGMSGYAIKLIKELKNSIRYQDLIFCDLTSIIDSNTQFEAIKIRFNKNTIISYKGTNNSIIGWKEDFRLSFMYPVYTQAMAKKYLKDKLTMFDTNVYLVGHSKGGNLAISASMETTNKIFKRIKRIVNFDGPGLLDKEYNSDKYNKIKDKLINYVPENSVIGILMNNTNYYYVKADGIGFSCHNIDNWYTYGTFFQKGEISKASDKIHENNLLSLRLVKKEELEKVIETFFAVVENNGIKRFSDIKKMNKTVLLKTINDLSDVSSETKEYFMNYLKTFFMPGRNKK